MTNAFRTFTLAATLASSAIVLVHGQALQQADLKRLYGSRWVVLPFPDSRMVPGSIVSIKRGQVAWESSLKSCGASDTVMKATPSDSGQVVFNAQSEYAANAVLGIKGVEVGPNFNRVKKATLKAGQHGPEGLDRIVIGTWFNDPGTKLPAECTKFLAQKDVFIVQEGYKVAKGSYTLFADTSTKINLTGLNLGIVKLSAGGSAKAGADGTLEFSQPVYTAIRRLKRMADGSLQTLGRPGGEKTDDAEAQKIFDGVAK